MTRPAKTGRCLVVGGGIIGLTIARELDERGADVAVWDRGWPGQASSRAAAGMLAPLTEAEHAATTPLAGHDETFFHLCVASRDLWPELAARIEEESGRGVDLDRSGTLAVSTMPSSATWLAELERIAEVLEEPGERLTPAQARGLLPDLGPEVDEALWLKGDWRIDNVELMAALEAALRHRGVEIRSHFRVERIAQDRRSRSLIVEAGGARHDFDRVVVAAGADLTGIGGHAWPAVRPVRGQMISWQEPVNGRAEDSGRESASPSWRGCLRDESLYAVFRSSGEWAVGATVEEAGFDLSTTPEARHELVDWATRLLPSLRGRAPSSQWAGLRPGSPDGRPFLGWAAERLFLAVGHFRNGILLAPWTARLVAAALLDESVEIPAPVALDRDL